MTVQDCIEFAKHNPTCYLATVEGDQPRVRALGLWIADESGFYFQTGTVKDFCQQLKHNPKTEGDNRVLTLAINKTAPNFVKINT